MLVLLIFWFCMPSWRSLIKTPVLHASGRWYWCCAATPLTATTLCFLRAPSVAGLSPPIFISSCPPVSLERTPATKLVQEAKAQRFKMTSIKKNESTRAPTSCCCPSYPISPVSHMVGAYVIEAWAMILLPVRPDAGPTPAGCWSL